MNPCPPGTKQIENQCATVLRSLSSKMTIWVGFIQSSHSICLEVHESTIRKNVLFHVHILNGNKLDKTYRELIELSQQTFLTNFILLFLKRNGTFRKEIIRENNYLNYLVRCCVFRLANMCFGRHLLVRINFFSILAFCT